MLLSSGEQDMKIFVKPEMTGEREREAETTRQMKQTFGGGNREESLGRGIELELNREHPFI